MTVEQTKERYVQKQVLFWALLGPFLLFLTLFVSLLNDSAASMAILFAATIGLPLCWQLRIKGLAFALTLLAAPLVYFLPSLAFEEMLWTLAISFAASLSLFVTTLSFEESKEMIAHLQVESKSRLSTLWQLDEKCEENEKTFEREIQALRREGEAVQKELDHALLRLDATIKQNRLLSEEAALLTERSQKAKEEIYSLRSVNDERSLLLESELGFVVEEKKACERELAALKQQKEAVEKEATRLNLLLTATQEQLLLGGQGDANAKIQALEEALVLEKEKFEQLQVSTNLQIRNLEKGEESPKLKKSARESQELKKLKTSCKQLKEALKDKSKELEQTRHSLFRMQERLMSPGGPPR